MSQLKEYIEAQLATGERDLNILVKNLIHNIPEEVQREEFGWLVRARVKEALGLLQRPSHVNPSSRLAKIRAHFLDTPVYTSVGTSKVLGDCNFVELMEASALLRKSAYNYLKRAEMLDNIATYLREHNYTKVSDIPEDVLKELNAS